MNTLPDMAAVESRVRLIDELPPTAVVIPAYRAASHIRAVLAGIPPYVRHIVVVDDGSPDDTAEIAVKCQDPRVRVLRHANNQGVGGAVLTGYDVAVGLGAEIIVKMDSDDQMDPEYFWPLVLPIISGQADYVKGNRFLHARQLQSMPVIRRIGNAGLSFLTKIASGYWNIFDPTNGYTAIHHYTVMLLNKESIDRRYFFEISMLVSLSLSRAVVSDVYIPARYGQEVSSLSECKSIMIFPVKLCRAFMRRIIVQYFVRDFTAVSVFLCVGFALTLFGAVWGFYHWFLSSSTGVPASTGTVMLAVLPIILGLQLLLQAVVSDIQSVPTRPRQAEYRLASAWRTGLVKKGPAD